MSIIINFYRLPEDHSKLIALRADRYARIQQSKLHSHRKKQAIEDNDYLEKSIVPLNIFTRREDDTSKEVGEGSPLKGTSVGHVGSVATAVALPHDNVSEARINEQEKFVRMFE